MFLATVKYKDEMLRKRPPERDRLANILLEGARRAEDDPERPSPEALAAVQEIGKGQDGFYLLRSGSEPELIHSIPATYMFEVPPDQNGLKVGQLLSCIASKGIDCSKATVEYDFMYLGETRTEHFRTLLSFDRAGRPLIYAHPFVGFLEVPTTHVLFRLERDGTLQKLFDSDLPIGCCIPISPTQVFVGQTPNMDLPLAFQSIPRGYILGEDGKTVIIPHQMDYVFKAIPIDEGVLFLHQRERLAQVRFVGSIDNPIIVDGLPALAECSYHTNFSYDHDSKTLWMTELNRIGFLDKGGWHVTSLSNGNMILLFVFDGVCYLSFIIFEKGSLESYEGRTLAVDSEELKTVIKRGELIKVPRR